MKRLEVTTIIKECSDCPYANIWGLFCNKYKKKLPEMDKTDHYCIPDWCDLDELALLEEFIPELTVCYYNNGSCAGIMCMYADHESAIKTRNPNEIKFKCKKYKIWIVRR